MVTNNTRIKTAHRANSTGVSLRKIRRWYADDSNDVEGGKPPTTQTTSYASDDSEWKAKYEQVMSEMKRIEREKNALESSLAGAQGYNKKATSQIKDLQQQQQTLSEQLQGQLAEIESERDTLHSERQTLQQQLEATQQKLQLFEGRQKIRSRIPAEDQDLASLFVDTGLMDDLINTESDEQFTEHWDSLKSRIDALVNSRSANLRAGATPPSPNAPISRQTTNPAEIADFLMGASLSGEQSWDSNINAYLDMLESQQK